MKLFYLDCSNMTDKTAVHSYIRSALELPSHYGCNLDALYDCLTDFSDCTIVLQRASILADGDGYLQTLLSVFTDAAENNPQLSLKIEK